MKKAEETSGSPEKKAQNNFPNNNQTHLKTDTVSNNLYQICQTANLETVLPTQYDLSLSDNDGDAAYDNQEEISKTLASKNIPLKDKIMMGPLDKYQKYSIH